MHGCRQIGQAQTVATYLETLPYPYFVNSFVVSYNFVAAAVDVVVAVVAAAIVAAYSVD